MSTAPDINQLLLDAFTKAADGRAFTLPGPQKLYGHHGDGGTKPGKQPGKTVTFNGGTDLLFKGVRTGVRSPFIFEFEQMDSDEWPVIDIESKKVEQALPKLAGYLYGVIVEAGGFADEDTSGWQLQNYIARFGSAILDKIEADEAAAAAEAAVVQSERYKENDDWGQW